MQVNKLFFSICLSVFISSSSWALPIGNVALELIDFTVVQNLNKVDIKWSTSIKTGGPYFCIEKSKDGISFTKVVDLPAIENGSAYSNYFETDYQPYDGVSYYRIKQVDAEGNFRYSQVVTLKIGEEKNMETYSGISNNSKSLVNEVNIAGNETLLVLRDANGNDFYSKGFIGAENNTLNTINLSSPVSTGTYRIVGSSNNKLYAQKIVIK